MTPIEQQALALINEIYREKGDVAQGWFQRTLENKYGEALCRAIERHDAFKREVSDAVEDATADWSGDPCEGAIAVQNLKRFILPKPVDPLMEALRDVREVFEGAFEDGQQEADYFRELLAARNLEIREIGE